MSVFSFFAEATKKLHQSREQANEEKAFFSEWESKLDNEKNVLAMFSKASDGADIVTYAFDGGRIKFNLETYTISFYDTNNQEIKTIDCANKSNNKIYEPKLDLFTDLLNTASRSCKRSRQKPVSEIPEDTEKERYKVEHELKILGNVEEQIKNSKTIKYDIKTQTYTLDIWVVFFDVLHDKLKVKTKTHKLIYSIRCDYTPHDALKQKKYDYFHKLLGIAKKRYEDEVLAIVKRDLQNTENIIYFRWTYQYILDTTMVLFNSHQNELKVYTVYGKPPIIIDCKPDSKDEVQQARHDLFKELLAIKESRKNDIQIIEEGRTEFFANNR